MRNSVYTHIQREMPPDEITAIKTAVSNALAHERPALAQSTHGDAHIHIHIHRTIDIKAWGFWFRRLFWNGGDSN